ncbi:hypothetical protein FSP39_023451 [Pinctada imbricata]|uniref:PiggyBac transposable element-derived protein domain-containing protein n=1 Tax=Pinctada imbricata TaxID=66713 RepID=A0AA89CDK1_PINIB|nr:hypothetical protein FSP39_023451 [Pinctada imbricata]
MAESSESESEFEGFELRDVEEAEQRYLSKLIELDDLDSDIDISDVSDVEDEVNNDSESSDDETVLADLARWTENVRPTRIKDFTGPTPGPTSTMDEDKIEYDFFNLIWPEIIFEEIAKETNAYASKCIETRLNASWYDTNAGEMKAFFGAMIILGVLLAPAQDMYWLKDRMFHLSCIETKFSRTRFENIQRYLHTADTSTNPPRDQIGHDKLAHVRPLLDKIKGTVRDEYNGHREVAIDEAMVGFSGRLGFKQYVPLKPTKRGIKIWVRADPHNGYINDFQVYTGKVRGAPEKDLGARVVLDLMGPLFGLGHHVYCDSFFTSPDLFLRLWKEDTYACGTVRMNRKGLPQGLDKIKLKEQGQSIVRQKGDLTVSVWRDKKNITLLSTNCSSGQAEQVSRKQKDGSTKEVPCPLVVKLYNMYMNGVDHADQLRSTYNTARKSLKWWKYLLFFFI